MWPCWPGICFALLVAVSPHTLHSDPHWCPRQAHRSSLVWRLLQIDPRWLCYDLLPPTTLPRIVFLHSLLAVAPHIARPIDSNTHVLDLRHLAALLAVDPVGNFLWWLFLCRCQISTSYSTLACVDFSFAVSPATVSLPISLANALTRQIYMSSASLVAARMH
jgi:hypothetical protein